MTEKEVFELIQLWAYDIYQLNNMLGIPDDPVANWLRAEKEIKRYLLTLQHPTYTREDEA